MIDPMITSIRYSSGPARKKPQAGDLRIIGGVEHIRQQARVREGLPGAGAYLVSNGRPVWEWVIKDGPDDRRAKP